MNAPIRWQPDRGRMSVAELAMPGYGVAIGRGLLCRCPRCGQAPVFQGYLRVVPECASCAAPLGAALADDAPPYFTILVVAHVMVPLMLLVQTVFEPSDLMLAAISLPSIAALSIALLRPIKGGTVGLMLKLGLMRAPGDE